MVHGYSMSLSIMARGACCQQHSAYCMLRSIDSVCVNVNLRALFQLPAGTHVTALTPRHRVTPGPSRPPSPRRAALAPPRPPGPAVTGLSRQKAPALSRCGVRDTACICVACLC